MEITQELLREFVHYNPETGVFTYRERDRKWFTDDLSCFLWNKKCAGKPNGTVQSKGNGYRRIRICMNGKIYSAHRMAWLYMTGEKPPRQIDHIDRDGTNNRWSNLRDGTRVNQRNKSMQRNNKSGITGVSWSKSSSKWCARVWCTENGKSVYKHLGLFDDKHEAGRAVEDFRRLHSYHPDHGRKKASYL